MCKALAPMGSRRALASTTLSCKQSEIVGHVQRTVCSCRRRSEYAGGASADGAAETVVPTQQGQSPGTDTVYQQNHEHYSQ